MSSKMITDQRKLGRRVAATTADRQRNDRAVQGVIDRCSDVVPEGTTSLTLEETQYYLGQQIGFEMEAARFRDDAHVKGLVDLDAKRKERDTATVELYGVSLRTRRAFESVHGEGAGKKLVGLDNEVPNDPTRLHQMVGRCREWLRDPNTEMPPPEIPGFVFDREAMAAGIDAPLTRLGNALDALPHEERHTVDTLVSKMQAMQRLDQLIGRSARLMEALYDIAGMEGESDRIRQSSHRSTASTEKASEETPSEEPSEESAVETS